MADEAKEKKPVTEKPTNCSKCNKRLKRKSWYYRNGNYYCTKRCWKLTNKKKEQTKETK